ncbi:MAG: hypothetical protein JSU69_10785, partial [Candidatus Zixiibacteriota bacterium]
MKRLTCILIFVLAFSNVAAQTSPDSAFERMGIEKLGALLNLNLSDLAFRDDYTKKDEHRLTSVGRLMHSPYEMIAYAESVADDCRNHNLERILRVAFENLARESQSGDERRLRRSVADLSFEGMNLFYSSIELNRLLMKVNSYLYKVFPTAHDSAFALLSVTERDFLINEFKEILVEDTADETKSVEVLDSIQQAEEEYIRQFVEFGAGIRKDFLLASGIDAAIDLFDEVEMLMEEIEKGEIDVEKMLSDTAVVPDRTGIAEYLGKHDDWAVGGTGDDRYEGDYYFIIDFGGDDRYELSYDPLHPHGTIIIDISGNDIYSGKTDFTVGSGCLSVGLLYDFSGDDIYSGASFSCGSGYFGLGLVYDGGGNDKYYGDTHTQGAGTFGAGILLGAGGGDIYSGALYAQGFGMTEGFGLIADYDGNDNYFAGAKYKDVLRYDDHYISLSQGFAYGIRPYMSGGIGGIVDFKGNDNYISDIFGQGASYWWALGMIYDSSGNDQYISYQYAQGSGTHMSVGILLDGDGDDFYRGKGLMQGCGHDYACGLILDRNGNDIYQADDLSQAAGS